MDMDPGKTSQTSHPSQTLRRKGSQRHTLRHARHSVTQGRFRHKRSGARDLSVTPTVTLPHRSQMGPMLLSLRRIRENELSRSIPSRQEFA